MQRRPCEYPTRKIRLGGIPRRTFQYLLQVESDSSMSGKTCAHVVHSKYENRVCPFRTHFIQACARSAPAQAELENNKFSSGSTLHQFGAWKFLQHMSALRGFCGARRARFAGASALAVILQLNLSLTFTCKRYTCTVFVFRSLLFLSTCFSLMCYFLKSEVAHWKTTRCRPQRRSDTAGAYGR